MVQAPIDPKDATPVQDRNDLLKPGYLKTEVGYCQMPDGTAFMANHLKMPNVTAEMLHWWFAWHGLESMRYVIWNKDDHYDVVVKNGTEAQLKDQSIPMAERIYGVSHTVTEDTGFGPEKSILISKTRLIWAMTHNCWRKAVQILWRPPMVRRP